MDTVTNDNEWDGDDAEMNNYSLLFAWNTTLSAAGDDVGLFNISEMGATTDKDYIFDRFEIRAIFITLYTVVFCCCFFGNLLVILVVTLSRRLRSITNFFLANLAVADLCVGLFCVFQNLSMYLIPSWVFGNFLCKMYWFAHSLSYTASIFILVVICTERYFAIIHPITCKQMLTYTRLRIVIFGVWVLSAAYSVPKFIWVQTITVNITDGGSETICITHRKKYNSELFDMINFGLLYVIPLTVMTVLYTRIAVGLWRSSRQLEKHLNAIGTCAGLTATASSNVASNGDASQRQQVASPRYIDRPVATTPDSESSAQPDRPTWSRSVPGSDHAASSSRLLQTPLASGAAATRSTSPSASSRHSHHQQTGATSSCHGTNSAQNVLRARRGVVRMLIVVVLTFALCNLPYHARKMWQYWSDDYKGDSNFSSLFTPLTFLVTYFNSGINPLLYAFLSRNFRKGMRELLMCSFRNTKKNKGKRYLNKHNYPLSHSSFLRRGGSTRSTVKGNNTTTTSIR